MGHQVVVYVYDVTRGMARSMSQMLLGRQIDGVWHTGLMVYGMEYFFGGGGIASCPPSGTILGEPTVKIPMGETEVTQDIFHEYLHELANNTYRGSDYHLLDHNCNTFTNEICQFLTGQPIPSYITDLPDQVMSTPFGRMIRPFIDQMMVQVQESTAGGMHFEDNNASPNTANPTSRSSPNNADSDDSVRRGGSSRRSRSRSPGGSRRPAGSESGDEVSLLNSIDFKSIFVPKQSTPTPDNPDSEAAASKQSQQGSRDKGGKLDHHDLDLD